MWKARAGARGVRTVRVDVHQRTRAVCAEDLEVGSAPEYLPS